jgi:glycosyltransferase involved in cell wall biosynthesis
VTKPRLTLVVARYLPHLGGIEVHVAELARRVAAAGWQVTVATLGPSRRQDGNDAPEREVDDGVQVLRFPGQFPLAGHPLSSPMLWRYLRAGAGGADVVHVHNYHAPVVLPALASRSAGVHRIVFTPHYLGVAPGLAPRSAHAAYRQLIGPLLRRYQPALIHVSRTEASLFRSDLRRHWTPREVHVAPNGVRVADLVAADAEPVRGRVVLAASRLEPYKNVDGVVRALPHLPKDTWLAVAGDGPHRPQLEQLANRLGVADRLRLLGRLSWPELTRWYRAAQVFVSLSNRECYGMAVAEALAAGAGVVASDIPAHREVVTSAAYPVDHLVPMAVSPQELAAKIELAAGHREAPGSRATSTWDDMADAVLRVYGRP